MKFEINFTSTAASHIRTYRKFEQKIILDTIDEQLSNEPTIETRNRKRLEGNDLSTWELRVDNYRVFYDVLEDCNIVEIKAIGHKEHNILYIGGKEVEL